MTGKRYLLGILLVVGCMQMACSMGNISDMGSMHQAVAKGGTGLCGNFDGEKARLVLKYLIKESEDLAAVRYAPDKLSKELELLKIQMYALMKDEHSKDFEFHSARIGGCIRREIQTIRHNLRTQCTAPMPTSGTAAYDACVAGYQDLIKRIMDDGQPLVEVARKIRQSNQLLLQLEVDALEKQCRKK